jgi:hypothetical protein
MQHGCFASCMGLSARKTAIYMMSIGLGSDHMTESFQAWGRHACMRCICKQCACAPPAGSPVFGAWAGPSRRPYLYSYAIKTSLQVNMPQLHGIDAPCHVARQLPRSIQPETINARASIITRHIKCMLI